MRHVAFQANVLKGLFGQAHTLFIRHSLKGKGKSHVFQRRVIWHKIECLKYESNIFLTKKYKLALVHPFQMLAVYHHLTGCGGFKAGQKVQKGGFAAAASAYYAAELSGHYFKVHSPKGVNIHAAYLVYLFGVTHADYGLLLHVLLRDRNIN